MRNLLTLFLLFAYIFNYAQTITIPNPSSYPQPVALSSTDNAKLGELMPRVMNLLKDGKKVKIAAYGQSLSDGNNTWWATLGDAIKVAYPNADIEVKTYGVGGVSSDRLWRLTNQELVAFHPDLVIFHVYGNHYFYETIIRQIRGCIGAEILIQTDHIANGGTGSAGSWDYNLGDMTNWDNDMSFQIVPGYCNTYGLERDNRRKEWYDYIRANSYLPSKLISDVPHFNEHGQWLVASLTARHFVYNAARNADPKGIVKYYEVGKDIMVVDGKITLDVTGNRIELIPTEKTTALIDVKIDYKKPSEYSNCYYFTIPTGGFWAGAPFLKPGMGIQQEEDWTFTMTGSGNFSLKGSKTGNDGTGNINNAFISNSKRVVLLNKNDWGNYGAPKTSGDYTFKSVGMFKDQIDFNSITFTSGKENEILAVQGLENKSHKLELSSSNGIFPIKYIKVYKPAFKLSVTAPEFVTANINGGTVTINVQGNTFWMASHRSTRLGNLSKWNNIKLDNGSDFAIDDASISISVSVPKLTGVNATEYVYIYGQGCDVKVVEIRQGVYNSIEDKPIINNLTFYPNPASDFVYLDYITDQAQISISSLQGQLLKSFTITEPSFSVAELPCGYYIVKIKTGGVEVSQKLSIIR